jgi:hypothetical protein
MLPVKKLNGALLPAASVNTNVYFSDADLENICKVFPEYKNHTPVMLVGKIAHMSVDQRHRLRCEYDNYRAERLSDFYDVGGPKREIKEVDGVTTVNGHRVVSEVKGAEMLEALKTSYKQQDPEKILLLDSLAELASELDRGGLRDAHLTRLGPSAPSAKHLSQAPKTFKAKQSLIAKQHRVSPLLKAMMGKVNKG